MANPRATKKQQELLQFVDGFVKGHGYGPSYREIMRAIGYKSVSTVATHIDQLIAKGYMQKTDNSARSLSVTTTRQAESPRAITSTEAVRYLEGLRVRLEKSDELGYEQQTALETVLILIRNQE